MRGSSWRWCLLALIALVSVGGCTQQAPAPVAAADEEVEFEPRLYLSERLGQAAEDPYFIVLGLTDEEQESAANMEVEERRKLLTLRVVGIDDDAPDVAGDVYMENNLLHFKPRYRLVRGTEYRLTCHRSRFPDNEDRKDVTEYFELVYTSPAKPATLSEIYPSGHQVPENLLKFYLHFSAPMSRGEAYRRIRLLDADGHEVADPFLELGEELWDPDMKRFTLLFDPGRIKRGLKPREEVGPVLEEGKQYTLVIDRDWADATGYPLAAEVRKTFDAMPPDEAPLDVDAWKIDSPGPGTRDPLVVRFPEPLDHSLLMRVVRVVDASDKEVPGEIEITDVETVWRFTPEHAWEQGEYRVAAATTLEDLAGNSIGRAFDVDVLEPVQKQIATDKVMRPFAVR